MPSSQNIDQDVRPKINSSLLLVILGLLSAFAPLATDMYLSSFPLLTHYFDTSMGMVSMSLSVYFLGLAGGQLLYGPLIDRYGRKPLLLLGIFIFVFSSLLIIFTTSIHVFIALRLLQAMGSCAGMIIARAIISDLYEKQEAARFFSLMMIVVVIAPIISPILGGFLVANMGWKYVFVFLAAYSLGCFILVRTRLPETLHQDNKKRSLFPGILKTYARLLIKRDFIIPTLIGAISFGELFAFISGSPFVYMHLHGVSSGHFGFLFGINAVGMIFTAKMNHSLLKYISPQKILWAGVGCNLFFSLILVCFAAQASLILLLLLVLLSLIWLPAIGANATALAMEACAEQRGSASGMLGVIQFGLASLTSACLGLLHNGTVYPMAGLILGCSGIATAVLILDKYGSRLFLSYRLLCPSNKNADG